MTCLPIDPACIGQWVSDTAFGSIAEQAGKAAGEMIVTALTWWVRTPSVDPDSDAVHTVQAYTTPIVVIIMVASILIQGLRMCLSRKKDPAIDVAVGLLRYAIVQAIALTLLSAALKAADALSTWLARQVMTDFTAQMQDLLTGAVIGNTFALFVIAAVGFSLAIIQWILAFLRQAGILVLASMLPLAASGSLIASTKVWLNRIIPWLATLVVYKPMAACIYLIGFELMSRGHDLSTVITGVLILFLACLAMPALLRFFSWAHTNPSGGSGGGGAFMAGAVGAMSVVGTGSRSSSVTHASYIDRTGPGSAPAVGSGASQGSSPDPTGAALSAAGATAKSGLPGALGASQTGTASKTAAAGGSAASGAASGAAAAAGGAAAGAGVAIEMARRAWQATQDAARNVSDDKPNGEQGSSK